MATRSRKKNYYEEKVIDILQKYSNDITKIDFSIIYNQLNSFQYQLLKGIIRNKILIDFIIKNYSYNIKKKLLPYLEVIVYQLLFTKNKNKKIFINNITNIAKVKTNKKDTNFIYAIANKLLKKTNKIKWPESIIKKLSIVYSNNLYLTKKWAKEFLLKNTIKLLAINNKKTKTNILLNKNTKEEHLIKKLKEYGFEITKNPFCNRCLFINGKNLTKIPEYNDGDFFITSTSSVLAIKTLKIKEGEEVLDLCAAPGGKSIIAKILYPEFNLTLIDISKYKIELIKNNFNRLKINYNELINIDALKFSSKKLYDKIILDAPCSSTGIFMHKVQAKYKNFYKLIAKYKKIQYELIKKGLSLLKPGGKLLYIVCSIEKEEGILHFEKLKKEYKNIKILKEEILPNLYTPNYIYPFKHKIEGFFIGLLEK